MRIAEGCLARGLGSTTPVHADSSTLLFEVVPDYAKPVDVIYVPWNNLWSKYQIRFVLQVRELPIGHGNFTAVFNYRGTFFVA